MLTSNLTPFIAAITYLSVVQAFISIAHPFCRSNRSVYFKSFLADGVSFKSKHFSSFKDDDKSSDKLLERARLLREEAKDLESRVALNRKIQNSTTMSEAKPVTLYNSLNDSLWEIRFRVKDEQDDESDTRSIKPLLGSVVVKLKADGYTESIGDQAYFKKFWGWDEDDDEEKGVSGRYLLFSADTQSLEEAGFPSGTRLYFNIRIDRNESGIISLSDGKITCKKDLKTGFWGLFNSSGILAQFRVIGDFICKPIQID